MLIRLGYDLQFYLPGPLSYVAQLHVHPSRVADLREPDVLVVQRWRRRPPANIRDGYGNICTRFLAPAGNLRIWNSTLIEDSGLPDPVAYDAARDPDRGAAR